MRRIRNFIARYSLSAVLVLVAATLVLFVLALSQQSGDAAHNCHLVRTLTHVESEFIRTDAIDRKGALTVSERNQTLAGFRKIIGPTLLARIVKEQNALDTRTINYWRDVLVPEAESLVSAAKCPAK